MKKILLISALAFLCVCAGAQEQISSKMFWGLKGGVFYDSGSNTSESGVSTDPSTFSFTLKPSIGWYLGQNWMVGVKGEFTDNKVKEGTSESLFSSTSIRSIVSNLTLGNGLGSNYISWKILPYARYRVCSILTDKLNVWAELEVYAGQKYSRLSDGSFDSPNSIYGVALSPMISYNVTDKFMVCFTPDLIRWDGARNNNSSGYKDTGSFSAQFNPLYQILSGVFNINIIKRF